MKTINDLVFGATPSLRLPATLGLQHLVAMLLALYSTQHQQHEERVIISEGDCFYDVIKHEITQVAPEKGRTYYVLVSHYMVSTKGNSLCKPTPNVGICVFVKVTTSRGKTSFMVTLNQYDSVVSAGDPDARSVE